MLAVSPVLMFAFTFALFVQPFHRCVLTLAFLSYRGWPQCLRHDSSELLLRLCRVLHCLLVHHIFLLPVRFFPS